MVVSRAVVIRFVLATALLVQVSCTQEKSQKLPPPDSSKAIKAFTGGLCSNTRANSCGAGHPGYICPSGATCQITVARNGASVTVTVNGQPGGIVCVDKNASIQWRTTDSHSNFLGDFGDVSPLSSGVTYFYGDDSTPTSSNITTVNVDHCYKYSIKVCPTIVSGNAIPCGEDDPIVIIGDGN